MSGADATRPQDRGFGAAWLWLLAGAALQLVSNGRWIVAPATWLAPVGWLVFLERSRSRLAVPAAFGLFLAVDLVAWRGLVPAPGLLYYLIVGAYAIVYFLPYLLHRWLAPRLRGLAATLIFPSAWVGIEFAFERWVTPYGSWFSVAYTQTRFLPLLQVAAISGAAGISFLIAWFGAIAARMLDRGLGAAQRRRAALSYGVLFAAFLLSGDLRLAHAPAGGPLVRVAGILPTPALARELEVALAPVRQGREVTPEYLAVIGDIAERLNDDLFVRSAREARAGASLIAWSETAGRVLAPDETRFLERGRRLAREEKVYLLLAYGVWNRGAVPPFENKVVAIARNGDIAWKFLKARPIVGPESPFIRAGDGIVRSMETPFGKVGAVICHDLDFPGLLRQGNALGIGLMVGPSADWPAITPLHANMATLRSIESGFSLFRPTSTGRSVAVDTRARTLMAVDYAEDAVVAYVPTVPVKTVYGAVGDWLAWLCLGGLLVGVGLALVRRRP